jgi:hypothetical protein
VGGCGRKTGGCSDAIDAAALAAESAESAESAREHELEEHTAGPWEHTPHHLFDFDDPDFCSVDLSCSGGGDWGDYDHDSS